MVYGPVYECICVRVHAVCAAYSMIRGPIGRWLSLGILAGSLAHELNNLLGGIIAFLQLLWTAHIYFMDYG